MGCCLFLLNPFHCSARCFGFDFGFSFGFPFQMCFYCSTDTITELPKPMPKPIPVPMPMPTQCKSEWQIYNPLAMSSRCVSRTKRSMSDLPLNWAVTRAARAA